MRSTPRTGWSTSAEEMQNRTESCSKRASFGDTDTNTAEYCAQDVRDGMVDVYRKKCRTESCSKRASFGDAGYKNGGVLCAARPRQDGRRLQWKVQDRRLRKEAVIWSGRYKNGGLLCAACPGRDGRRHEQQVESRKLQQEGVVRSDR